jgi:hypothetical protein
VVPAGTNLNVVVTPSSAVGTITISSGRVITSTPTPADVDADAAALTMWDPQFCSVDINVPANGIGVMWLSGGGSTPTGVTPLDGATVIDFTNMSGARPINHVIGHAPGNTSAWSPILQGNGGELGYAGGQHFKLMSWGP